MRLALGPEPVFGRAGLGPGGLGPGLGPCLRRLGRGFGPAWAQAQARLGLAKPVPGPACVRARPGSCSKPARSGPGPAPGLFLVTPRVGLDSARVQKKKTVKRYVDLMPQL